MDDCFFENQQSRFLITWNEFPFQDGWANPMEGKDEIVRKLAAERRYEQVADQVVRSANSVLSEQLLTADIVMDRKMGCISVTT